MLNSIAQWRKGVRLYIAIAIILVTLETWWWASVTYGGTQLFATRLEEVFAWLSLGMITFAVAIGPFFSIWPRARGRFMFYDARRLIGVGAAWFASLHIAVAYTSLFKLANPLDLPKSYQQAFAVGLIAMVILLAMAGTSFDKAFKGMGVWWFRLHRLVYLALITTLLHAFLIGSHATNWLPLIVLTAAALFILIMHSYLAFVKASKPSILQIFTISYIAVVLVAVLNYGYTQKLGYNPIEGKNHSQKKS